MAEPAVHKNPIFPRRINEVEVESHGELDSDDGSETGVESETESLSSEDIAGNE
jgi:hypothetical protein